jgi:hypothetical protein
MLYIPTRLKWLSTCQFTGALLTSILYATLIPTIDKRASTYQQHTNVTEHPSKCKFHSHKAACLQQTAQSNNLYVIFNPTNHIMPSNSHTVVLLLGQTEHTFTCLIPLNHKRHSIFHLDSSAIEHTSFINLLPQNTI